MVWPTARAKWNLTMDVIRDLSPRQAVSEKTGTAWQKNAPALARWALDRLANRTDAWGAYIDPSRRRGTSNSYTAKENGRGPLNVAKLTNHFAGGQVLGLHSTSPDDTCRSIGIDLDMHGDDPDLAVRNHAAAVAWAERLADEGFVALLTDSNGRGGFHLRVMFAEPIASEVAFSFAEWIIRDADEYGVDAETFPKQPNLAGLKFGNWLRIPGRHHTRDHWTRVWSGDGWLEGQQAIDYILAIAGDDPELIPDAARLSIRIDRPVELKPFVLPEGVELSDVQRQAADYVATAPPAVSGQGGHNITWGVAHELLIGFGLSEASAFPLLAAYNARLAESWTDAELRHKLNLDAHKVSESKRANPRAIGYLLTMGSEGQAPASLSPKDVAAALAAEFNFEYRDADDPLPLPTPRSNPRKSTPDNDLEDHVTDTKGSLEDPLGNPSGNCDILPPEPATCPDPVPLRGHQIGRSGTAVEVQVPCGNRGGRVAKSGRVYPPCWACIDNWRADFKWRFERDIQGSELSNFYVAEIAAGEWVAARQFISRQGKSMDIKPEYGKVALPDDRLFVLSTVPIHPEQEPPVPAAKALSAAHAAVDACPQRLRRPITGSGGWLRPAKRVETPKYKLLDYAEHGWTRHSNAADIRKTANLYGYKVKYSPTGTITTISGIVGKDGYSDENATIEFWNAVDAAARERLQASRPAVSNREWVEAREWMAS